MPNSLSNVFSHIIKLYFTADFMKKSTGETNLTNKGLVITSMHHTMTLELVHLNVMQTDLMLPITPVLLLLGRAKMSVNLINSCKGPSRIVSFPMRRTKTVGSAAIQS